MGRRRIIVDAADYDRVAAEWIEARVEQSLQQAERCHLMLAGGGTPLSVYRLLAERDRLPWIRLTLFFGDERCVPPEHQASNYRAVKAALFPHGKPDELILYRMRGEDEPEQAARDYEGVLPAQLDILLLGIGEDGHTASLFPGSPALQEWQRRVVTVVGSKPPPRRLSVTPAVIRAARHLLMLAKGESKAEAVRRALQEGDVPSALADTGDWLMDRGAAQALPAEE